MRLISATVKNYRVHRELRVEFDPARTLIGGPNESGKSTLVEAIHRALFLKAKGSTEYHRTMVSHHGGVPEVDLVFAVGRREYRVRKRFGLSGTTTLVPPDAATLSGEAAENELSRLLSVEAGASGKTAVAHWSHVWVWQGQSGEDPCLHANQQQASLLRRLQESGGAAVLQSELDARVAAAFAARRAELWIQTGKSARTGSALDRAEREVETAQLAYQEARDRQVRLEQASRQFDEASRQVTELKTALDRLDQEKRQTQRVLLAIAELKREEQRLADERRRREEHRVQLQGTEAKIAHVRAVLAERGRLIEPRQQTQRELAWRVAGVRQHLDAVEREIDAALRRSRKARGDAQLHQLWVRRFELTERRTQLEELLRAAEGQRQLQRELRAQLSDLPPVDRARLRDLQTRSRELASAEAALQGMSATIEVVTADQPVTIGREIAAAGLRRIISEDTEIVVGDGTRLRVSPGGGSGLLEARRRAAVLREELRAALQQLGLGSVEQAEEALRARESIELRLAPVEAALRTSSATPDPQDALARTVEDLGRLSAQLEQILADRRNGDASGAPVSAPTTLEQARQAVPAAESAVSLAEAEEKRHLLRREVLQKELAAAEGERTRQAESLAQDERALLDARAQLNFWLESAGDDSSRQDRLQKAETENREAEAAWKEAGRKLAELFPDQVQSDHDRLTRAWEQTSRLRSETELQQARAQTLLQSDGGMDPEAELALAAERLARAQERMTIARRQAEAVRRIDELFVAEQRSLSDQFTRPLADRISGYLECLFGAGARVAVTHDARAFREFTVTRTGGSGGTFPFDGLSGGTREQVAAAVRLAIAEVLAAEHDGCLPVIFDDAFAYADSERLRTLQRMLDRAAARGLQVILLTCTPLEYAGLGAQAHVLPRAG